MMKIFIRICLTQIFIVSVSAQTTNFGLWTTVQAEKKIGDWEFNINTELRTIDNLSKFQRWNVRLEATYKIAKPIKLGVNYKYLYFNDEKYSDIQPRQRYAGFMQGSLKHGNIKLILREQCQRTIKDERDRIREDGTYDSYSVNPEWIWRNRLKMAYDIPNCKLTPSFSVETFYLINHADKPAFNEMRYKLSCKYKISKHHSFNFYGLIDQEINIEIPTTTIIGGLKYTYSF